MAKQKLEFDEEIEMILRKANMNEANTSYQCIEDAREYHASLGFTQWHPGYPTLRTIEEDIENGIGFVFEEGNEVIGYCGLITFDGGPKLAYEWDR